MKLRVEEKVEVGARADDVYAYVSDFLRHGEWSSHGLQVSKDGDGPIEQGATFSTVAKQFGTQREKSTIVEVSPPRRFVWESAGGLGLVRHWFEVGAAGDAATLTKGIEFVKPKFIAKAMSRKLAGDVPKAIREDLAKIKATLER